MNDQPSDSDALALARHAAVSWIQEALKQNFTLVRATALASERSWGGKLYSASTLEEWYYLFRHQGFPALKRRVRKDRGTRKALSPDASQVIVELRRKYPQLKVKVLVRQLVEQGVLQVGTFSLPSVYRLLATHQLDARSIKRTPPVPGSGPTKAFECARANELWMTDLMFGPTLKTADGKVIQTRRTFHRFHARLGCYRLERKLPGGFYALPLEFCAFPRRTKTRSKTTAVGEGIASEAEDAIGDPIRIGSR